MKAITSCAFTYARAQDMLDDRSPYTNRDTDLDRYQSDLTRQDIAVSGQIRQL